MRFLADIMILFGAVLLTFGTDLVMVSHNDPVGTPLGIICSLIGVMLLTAGILNHHRLSLKLGRDEKSGAGGTGPERRDKAGERRS